MENYLILRGLPFKRCLQPHTMPRPDLTRLGIQYRRIPIMAIGRDVYCDTRIIIEKLEQLFPEGTLGSQSSFEQGLERIFEAWVIDAGPFWRTVGCLPTDLPMLQDPTFLKDRYEASGGTFTVQALERDRAMNLAHLRLYFDIAEKLLSDGRQFLMQTSKPSLADIHAIFCFDWALHVLAIPEHVICRDGFPAVYAWIDRFREVYETANTSNPPGLISSEEALETILASSASESDLEFDHSDPLGFGRGQRIIVTPTDLGFTHSDTGELVSLTTREVVIKIDIPEGLGHLQLHFPRNNFRIELCK